MSEQNNPEEEYIEEEIEVYEEIEVDEEEETNDIMKLIRILSSIY